MFRYRLAVLPQLILVTAPGVLAARVPGRFIVELSTEPVAEHVRRLGGRERMNGAAAKAYRSRVRDEQARMRSQFGPSATIVDGVQTVANALFVEASDDVARQLANTPGVLRVHPVRSFHMVMDRAVAVTRVTEAWDQIGLDRAGAGVKIAIIDSGIDVTHPAFQDSSLPALESYPKVNATSDQAYTNSKIIVARSYVSLLGGRDPDRSARDRVGHGTALAMVAAGLRSTGPRGTVMGVAPRAYLGNYKVFGTPGYNDTTTDEAILKAIDDAVADGMDVINLSLGYDLAPRLEDDVEVQAIERATRAGVIVVAAAGNNGPGVNSISSPATAPSAISVGASHNDRIFAGALEVADGRVAAAIPSTAGSTASTVTGAIVDVATIDGDGLACGSLPAGSLNNSIALVLRGNCTFETKLNNAQRAGAVGAVVYAAESAPDPFSMSVGAATLPAEMISYADGSALKAVSAGQSGTLRFTIGPVPVDSNRLADFSASGPNVDAGIKPDLVAVGTDVTVATQTLDPNGDMYDPSGFITVDGTSFSTPMVAGVAALLKSARPGLTADQYRSLIINSATAINARPNVAATVQQDGAGLLNAGAALRSTLTAYPTQVDFGHGGGDVQVSRTLTLTNVGNADESYSLLFETADQAVPVAAANVVQVAAGQSIDVPLTWQATGLTNGAHEGVLRITGSTSGVDMRVPYWYGVTSDTPSHITLLEAVGSGRRGGLTRDAVLFRLTDASGLPLAFQPTATVVSGDGSVQSISSYDGDVPGMYGIAVRLGTTVGTNTFRIQAGDAVLEFSVTGR